jgi:prepilin-type processing-associated H-X9-DG protein
MAAPSVEATTMRDTRPPPTLRAFTLVESRRAGMSGKKPTAFTLVELLVVIGVIVVLIALLLPAMAHARRQAMTLVCASNLRVDGQALINYAALNKGLLPMHPGMAQGHWLWDMPIPTRDAMLRYGAHRKTMYCPFAPEEDGDGHWTFGTPPVCVTGYFWLIMRVDGPLQFTFNGVRQGIALQWYVLEQRKTWVVSIKDRKAAEREVGLDAVMQDPATLKFGGIRGGWIVPHNTAHLATGGRPLGGNILYLDGHVAWRNFRDMRFRLQAQGGPKFYF